MTTRAGKCKLSVGQPAAELEVHHRDARVQEPLGLTEREVDEKPQPQAVSMARSEYRRCPPRMPRRPGSQPAMASGVSHSVAAASNEGAIVRNASSRRGTWTCTWDEPSTSSLQCGLGSALPRRSCESALWPSHGLDSCPNASRLCFRASFRRRLAVATLAPR